MYENPLCPNDSPESPSLMLLLLKEPRMFCHTAVTDLRPDHEASGPSVRSGVRLIVRWGVSLEPDPRTDPLDHLTLQVNRLTHGGWLVLTDPCLGVFPWGSAPYCAVP
jgi:hypothetical protein